MLLIQKQRVQVVILREDLEAFFGADASPASWLAAYAAHREAIDRAAADAWQRRPDGRVVVLRPGHRRPADRVSN